METDDVCGGDEREKVLRLLYESFITREWRFDADDEESRGIHFLLSTNILLVRS